VWARWLALSGAVALVMVAMGSAAKSVVLGDLALDSTTGAQMLNVYDCTGELEHVYIRIPGGIVGRGGKRIRDPKTRKVIDTWGFYFRPQSDHGHKLMPGLIKAPDPMSGQAGGVASQDNDPCFVDALAYQIKLCVHNVPTYTWGDRTHPEYVCWSWANDMWNRALAQSSLNGL
jgi:hypothetical protein